MGPRRQMLKTPSRAFGGPPLVIALRAPEPGNLEKGKEAFKALRTRSNRAPNCRTLAPRRPR
eukprot:1142960-Pyramimonas_sp.AAC.1